MIPVLLGMFFQGAEVGKQTNLPWAIPVTHYDGYRHPVQLYEIIMFLLVGIWACRRPKYWGFPWEIAESIKSDNTVKACFLIMQLLYQKRAASKTRNATRRTIHVGVGATS